MASELFIAYLNIMYSAVKNKHSLILISIGLVIITVGLVCFYSPPSLYPDASYGFHVMQAMERGGMFNMTINPANENIAENNTSFLAWWSPGQYLLPYLFKFLSGLNIAHATVIATFFSCFTGIIGFYLLFLKWGFSKIVSALSIAFIVLQQFYFEPFIFYNGGETILFAFIGWFVLGCFSFRKINWKLLAFALISGWIGFFCKASFLWMYAAGLCCTWINISIQEKGFYQWIKNGLIISLPAIISLLFIYKYYLSRGPGPASVREGFHFSLNAFIFPLASPTLSGFSLDEVFGGLLYHAGPAVLDARIISAILCVLAILTIAIIVVLNSSMLSLQYKIGLTIFYTTSVLFFGYLFLERADVSMESRHFRILGLILIPGVFYLVSRLGTLYKTFFIVLAVSIILLGFRFLISGWQKNHSVGARGNTGFAQLNIDQPSLDYLEKLDQENNNALFAFKNPDTGLEIVHNRIITLSWGEPEFKLSEVSFDGHAGPVFVLVPVADTSLINAGSLQNIFPEYSAFTSKLLTKNYILYNGQ